MRPMPFTFRGQGVSHRYRFQNSAATDFEWTAIRRSFRTSRAACLGSTTDVSSTASFWISRSGAPWCDLPESFGPYTTCYNRFVRWRIAGIWDLITEAFAETHDGSVQMIDTSIVRVHQHGGCAGRGETRLMGRSRGGLTTKIHACVDTNGMPVRLELTTDEQVPESRNNSLAGTRRCPRGMHPCTQAAAARAVCALLCSAYGDSISAALAA